MSKYVGTYIQILKVYTVLKILTTQASQVYSGVPQPSLAAQLAGVTPEGVDFFMKLHLDQASQGFALLLSDQEIAELMDDWRDRYNDGEEPVLGSEATSHQISTLNTPLNSGDRPYADFAIWRPHGDDFQRALEFTARIPQADGTIHL